MSRLRLMMCAMVASVACGVVWSSSRGPSAKDIARGRELFLHEWTVDDPLAHGGDGLGPVFNRKSCVACHFLGGTGGAGPAEVNVLGFEAHPVRNRPQLFAGVIHADAVMPDLRESLDLVRDRYPIIPGGTRVVQGCQVRFDDFDPLRTAQSNTPALFGVGRLDGISGGAITRHRMSRTLAQLGHEMQGVFADVPIGRERILPDGRVGKFGWKAQFATLEEFVAAACAVEVGLSNPMRRQDLPGEHRENEEAKLDLDRRQFAALVGYVGALPQPRRLLPEDSSERAVVVHGEELFQTVGCADCHVPDLAGVAGLYSDLLLYRLTPEGGASSYGTTSVPDVPLPEDHPSADEWKTTPLWGVADSAPYLHDGSTATLDDAIRRHGGDGLSSLTRYRELAREDQAALIAFLETLRAPEIDADPKK